MVKKKETKTESVVIPAPNFQTAEFLIRGTTPLVMNKFSTKMRQKLHIEHEAGTTPKTKKKKEPKDFEALYEGSKHYSTEGWIGIPAIAFRKAAISACRLCGFKMTLAKLSIEVIPDGHDEEKYGLIRITKGEPEYLESICINSDGSPDLRARAAFSPGWEAVVTIKWDADQFKLQDVANLLMRIGLQVGILEGRPDSKNSAGQGWGLFTVVSEDGDN